MIESDFFCLFVLFKNSDEISFHKWSFSIEYANDGDDGCELLLNFIDSSYASVNRINYFHIFHLKCFRCEIIFYNLYTFHYLLFF